MRGDITIVPLTEIKITIQEYCEELYTNKLDNLDEVEKHKDTNYRNRLNKNRLNQ